MNWTNALAVFGAVTGAASFGWQIWSHRLTGGRVEVLSTRQQHDGHWWVRTDVSNVGRLDVTIVDYSIWRDIPGHHLRRALWRLRAVQKVGWKRARRTELIFTPQSPSTHPCASRSTARAWNCPLCLKPAPCCRSPS